MLVNNWKNNKSIERVVTTEERIVDLLTIHIEEWMSTIKITEILRNNTKYFSVLSPNKVLENWFNNKSYF